MQERKKMCPEKSATVRNFETHTRNKRRMTILLTLFLNFLAQIHRVTALLIFVYVCTPYATLACTNGHDHLFCHKRVTLFTLDKILDDAEAYSSQVFAVFSPAILLVAVLLYQGKGVYSKISAFLDPIGFVFSIISWSLIIGLMDRKSRFGAGLWIFVFGSFVLLVGLCLGLSAQFISTYSITEVEKPEQQLETNDLEKKLPLLSKEKDATEHSKENDNKFKLLLNGMDFFAQLAVVTSIASVASLYDLNNDDELTIPAKGCQIAVALLSFDVAVLTGCIRRKIIDVQMGSIVASSIALVTWIVGIVGCSLIGVSTDSFDAPAIYSLVSLLASLFVFAEGIYIGTHYG